MQPGKRGGSGFGKQRRANIAENETIFDLKVYTTFVANSQRTPGKSHKRPVRTGCGGCEKCKLCRDEQEQDNREIQDGLLIPVRPADDERAQFLRNHYL